MEWALLVAIATVAAVYIALPRRDDRDPDDPAAELDDLRAQRDELVAALRDLDDDVAAGRMSAEDRQRGRLDIGARLRDVLEQMRLRGARG